MTPKRISRQLVGNPFRGDKFTHYIEINVVGLNVVKGRPGVYLIPNKKPLDLTNRIVNYGKVIAK